MNNRIANKYSIGENIGSGCFGSVFNGTHYKTNMPVAIKMEDVNADVKILKNETTILKYLYDQGSRDIPIVYWFGIHNNKTCLVMSLYDCSLHDYIQQKPLPQNKIDVIMRTMINIFQSIHNRWCYHSNNVLKHCFSCKKYRKRTRIIGISICSRLCYEWSFLC